MSKNPRVIPISFRDTTRDITLYITVISKEKNEKSEFVKDAIEFYLKYSEKNKSITNDTLKDL